MKLLNWIRKRSVTNKQKVELSEKKELEKSLEKEKNRKTIEKYKIEFIRWGWLMLPALAGFILVILFIGNLLMNRGSTTSINWALWAPFGLIALLVTPAFSFEDEWKKRLEIKTMANTADKYEAGYFYTDSKFDYLTYKLSKKIVYLINILAILATIVYVIWSISNYQPTASDQYGFIIFLLVLIAVGVWFKR